MEFAVTVTGPLDATTSMITDLLILDRVLANEVTILNDTHLNHAVPRFAYGATLPTCEALAVLFAERIAARLPAGVRLERVRVAEDATLYAEWVDGGE